MWYKAVFLIGGLGFLTSIAVTNNQGMILSLGMFLIGIGEWKNHRHSVAIKEANMFTGPATQYRVYTRKPNLGGYVLLITGLILFVISILDILDLVSLLSGKG